MVRNKLAMAVLALSVLQANVASALGLGNLSVKSALNQPLNAEIKLLDIGDLDAAQIRIQLGSPDDFQRASVERDYFLTNLKFNIDLDGRGGGVVRISTHEPVVEPYLNFVIEARWPNGRVLREFAVLLDPPTFNANRAPAPVAPATSSAPAAKPKRAIEPPTVATEPAPAPAPSTAGMALPTAHKDGEYRIQVYDTLSKIAAQHRPADDVSVEQTMLAIQRANPQVFIRNNVNLIKSGYVIRLPSADEARALGAAQAANEVEEQVREWRGGSRGSAAPTAATGPQLDGRAPEPTDKEGGYKEQARLSIAAPGGTDKSSAGEGSSGTGAGKGVEALRSQLTASQESLEKGRRDNQELQSRLDDMERQIATLQRLISLKDDQLAALQTRSAEPGAAPSTAPAAGSAATAPATTPPETAAPAATPPASADAPAAGTSTTTTATTTTTTTTTPAPAKAAPVAAKPAPVAEPSLLERATANPLYLAGAGAVVVLLAGLALQRRRKAAAEEREAMSDFVLDDHVDFSLDDSPDQEHVRIDDAAATVVAESAAADRAAELRTSQPPVRSETGDAIAEADIYIAYGRYQQAVDLLSHAIDAEPARSDLRVKLLEVCLEMRNREAFRQQFVALQGLGDGDAIAHAKDLLSSVDGVSDWLVDLPHAQRPVNEVVASAAVAATAATAAIAAAHSLEQDDFAAPALDDSAFAGEPAPAALFAEPPAAAPAEELDLDLDDLGLGDELPAGAELELEDDIADLNFDKELGDLDLEDDLDLEGELDLDAPLDLAAGLDLDKELDLDGGAGLDKEIDLDGGSDLGKPVELDGGLQDLATARADELAEDLDLESHPGLDSEFDRDAELEAELPAPVAPAPVDELGHFESELGVASSLEDSALDVSAFDEKADYDFQIDDVEDDLAAAPTGGTSFDLDSTSIELAGGPSPVATPEETTSLAEEPKLDLADDGLELALDEMGETGYLNDLENTVDALHDLDQPVAAAPVAGPSAFEAALADEFDLGNLDADLPDIDRLDLSATAGDLPELPAESTAAELPDLAELPPEFDAAAAALDAEDTPADADDEFDFLADADEIATKLDLARAYIDMGDTDGARDILDEVLQEGTDTQRQEASTLLDRIA